MGATQNFLSNVFNGLASLYLVSFILFAIFTGNSKA